jgi:hypothetical protein
VAHHHTAVDHGTVDVTKTCAVYVHATAYTCEVGELGLNQVFPSHRSILVVVARLGIHRVPVTTRGLDQELGVITNHVVQVGNSKKQLISHPSPSVVFPSSHCSVPFTELSPQNWVI